MELQFDLAVIGGGPGGYIAAIKAAKLGLKTALVEAKALGGTCLNRGCIPTKAMLHAAELYRQIRECGRFGIHVSTAEIDYPALLEYRESCVSRLVQGVDQLLRANSVTCFSGRGTLLLGKRIHIQADQELELSADHILLATGSEPKKLPLPGMALPGVLDSDQLFGLQKLPESLMIIGGGAIGVEFAEIFSSLHCRTVILEAQPALLPGMDREISHNLRMILRKRGVEIHTGVEIQEIRQKWNGLECLFTEKDTETSVAGEYVLCAVGRAPYTEGLFAPGAEPAMDHGRVCVDEQFRTSLEGIYAIGDLIGGAQLAHAAGAQGIYVAETLAGVAPSVDITAIPRCVYTEPEIASVGLGEDEAKKQGIPIRVGKFLMGANGKSLIAGAERGFVKIISNADTGVILGAQMMCERATDMIGELTTAVCNRLTVSQLLIGMRPHPTFNEGIGEALEAIQGSSIHAIPKKSG